MGLDTSHGCWHGAYGAFMTWRRAIAKAAGYPPLMFMEGFYNDEDFKPFKEEDQRFHMREAVKDLPISWTAFENNPLTVLLSHSDCDGDIKAKDCGPLADALEAVIPNLPTGDCPGHIGNWKDKTQTFVDGLREAAKAGDDVEFG